MKVIIFYAKYGGGHLSAARSIENCINTYYKNVNVELIDFMEYANKEFNKITTKAYAEMARDLNQKNTIKRNENLNIIIEETDRLNLLVNDILELSKEQSNVNKLNIEKEELLKNKINSSININSKFLYV